MGGRAHLKATMERPMPTPTMDAARFNSRPRGLRGWRSSGDGGRGTTQQNGGNPRRFEMSSANFAFTPETKTANDGDARTLGYSRLASRRREAERGS